MNRFYDEYNINPYQLHFTKENMLNIGGIYSNNVILDLYDTLVSICYHDFYTPRDENVSNSLKLNITIPVNNCKKFNEIKFQLNQLVKYMTNGEDWNINFVEEKQRKILDLGRLDLQEQTFDNICLLSGGLDALSGSSNEINSKTLFVSTETNDTEIINSNAIYEKFLKNDLHWHVVIKKIDISNGSHYTQRTRTLFFIANCLLYADYFNIDYIKMYENGIMSLNPKFYFRRMVTKTTHPKTLSIINEIFSKLNFEFKVINPYMFMTKTDVIIKLPDEWKSFINITKTCSKNHGIQALSNRKRGETHCGLCTACLLRQISVLSSGLDKKDSKYMLPPYIMNKDEIIKYEKTICKSGKTCKIEQYGAYKFLEKKSLLEYYKRYSDLIGSGKIYNYLDINPKYFEEENYFEKIDFMLKKFKKEIDYYFKLYGGNNEIKKK